MTAKLMLKYTKDQQTATFIILILIKMTEMKIFLIKQQQKNNILNI